MLLYVSKKYSFSIVIVKGDLFMENKKRSVKQWVEKHKTELVLTGASITAVAAVIIGLKNPNLIQKTVLPFKTVLGKAPETIGEVKTAAPIAVHADKVLDLKINKDVVSRIPHAVSEHVRDLPVGRVASAEKIATAAEHGFDLNPGQTWVKGYYTGIKNVA